MLGRHWPLALSVLLLGAGGAADGVEASWKSRADLATRRLAAPALLDTCDKAIERAFQKAKPTTGEGGTLYPLEIDVEGRKALVTYNYYKSGQLDSFAVLNLPSSWVLYQKTQSKTARFLAGDAKCAFELCTDGPTAEGRCAEKSP